MEKSPYSKKEKSQFVFLNLKERNGEREYFHPSVHEIPARLDINEFAEDYASEFYDPRFVEAADDGYYFNSGEVHVRVYTAMAISKSHYDIMRSYLNS